MGPAQLRLRRRAIAAGPLGAAAEWRAAPESRSTASESRSTAPDGRAQTDGRAA